MKRSTHPSWKLGPALAVILLTLVAEAQTPAPSTTSPATMPASRPVADDELDVRIFFPVGPPDARHLADLISELYHLDSAQPDPTPAKELGRLISTAAEDQTAQLVAVGDRKGLNNVH